MRQARFFEKRGKKVCRLFLADRAAFEWLLTDASEDFLTPYLAQLIKSNGGDGVGAAVLRKDGISWFKGVKVTADEMSCWMLDEWLAGGKQFLFHCRRATIGEVLTINCHPFLSGSGKNRVALAHNGHDAQLITDAEKEGYKDTGMPDSAAAAFLAYKRGPDMLRRYSGNFLGFARGVPFCIIGTGHWPMQRIETSSKGLIYCSELPHHIAEKCYSAEDLNPAPVYPVYTPAPVYTTYSQGWWRDGNRYYISRLNPPLTPAWATSTTRILSYDELGIPDKERFANGPDWHSSDDAVWVRRKRDNEYRASLLDAWEKQENKKEAKG